MRLFRTSISVIVFSGFVAFASSLALADQELKVDVKPGTGSDYNTSDITLDALKSGKMEYMVSGMGKSYTVKLTDQQIKNVLDGTTVMVDSMNGSGSKVRVSLTVEGEPESSGW